MSTPVTSPDLMPQTNRGALVNTIPAIIAIAYLWNTTVLKGFLYPLALFITFVHETGQRFVVALAGGVSTNFTIDRTGLGQSTIENTDQIWVYPAGFITSALVGMGLFYLVNRYPNQSNRIAFVLGLGTMIAGLSYISPLLPQESPALFSSILFGFVLIFLGAQPNIFIRLLMLNILIISLALEAFLSMRNVSQIVGVRERILPDAQVFADSLGPTFSATLVAISWGMLSLGLLLLVFRLTLWPIFKNTSTENE